MSFPLSPFELLPPELRHIIYTHLGLPVSKNLSFSSAQHAPPTYPSVQQTFCSEWTSGPLRLTGLHFTHAAPLKASPVLVCADGTRFSEPYMCGNEGCGMGVLKEEGEKWIVFNTAVMRVNKRIHTEMCELLYAALAMRFDFELSDYAVHAIRNGTAENGSLTHLSLNPSPPPSTHLTHIALSSLSGLYSTSPTPKFTPLFCRRILGRQISSLAYITTHCPHLQRLTYSPHARVLARCRLTHLQPLLDVLAAMVAQCRELESLEIEVYQEKPLCGCYNTRSAKHKGHEPAENAVMRGALSWEEGARPEEVDVTAWAKDVLVRAKGRKDLVMQCPNIGTYQGRWTYQ
ncbi:hypothetical protein CC86DRAFT_450938 [Ophiobolus disseminans]|uniref:Uncharacterized protein n=1 Tax=Ophiobolus disseminans TaxID=1469910 RepID=A0A6A7AIU8_9PLEO|nr:hypothetical protein CC86DRAFT_450938 [Ophiobolus disseminans]